MFSQRYYRAMNHAIEHREERVWAEQERTMLHFASVRKDGPYIRARVHLAAWETLEVIRDVMEEGA